MLFNNHPQRKVAAARGDIIPLWSEGEVQL